MAHLPRSGLRVRMKRAVGRTDLGCVRASVATGAGRSLYDEGEAHPDSNPTNVLIRNGDALAFTDPGISGRLDSDAEYATDGMLISTPACISRSSVWVGSLMSADLC